MSLIDATRNRLVVDTKQHAISMARTLLPEIVYNMSALEGNPFTLADVKMLLNGIEIGGRDSFDREQVLRISNA